jgi:hypothetical protein
MLTIDEQIAYLEEQREEQKLLLFKSTNDWKTFLKGEKEIDLRIDQEIREI